MIELKQWDCLAYLKSLPDKSQMLIFCDPPYALGSDVIIRPDCKPDYRKAVDFMGKWEQPDGAFWEAWFKEAFRVLKYGGRVVMFGMDRQLMLNKYYACFAGLVEQQSLYWYFTQNFPKSSNLGKMLDKNAGQEREVVGIDKQKQRPNADISRSKDTSHNKGLSGNGGIVTTPATPLAQKYDGWRYSVAPLKQTNETILVFQKPYKTKSCLHDTLAYENGDAECMCGAVDVEGNLCGMSEQDFSNMKAKEHKNSFDVSDDVNVKFIETRDYKTNENGRYPAQTFCDDEAAKVLDGQSGVQKSDSVNGTTNCKLGTTSTFGANNDKKLRRNDTGGCSRILHKCNYDDGDFDLYMYCPKVSPSQRDEGLKKNRNKRKKVETEDERNNHPTLKPVQLLKRVLQLFITPDGLDVLDPFMGSGSMGIAAVELGINYTGVELNPEYFEIATKRIQHAQNKKAYQLF